MNPWPKNVALRVLVGFWSFVTFLLASLFVFLPLRIAGQVVSRGWKDGAFDVVLVPGTLLFRKTTKWRGMSVGWFVFYRDNDSYSNPTVRTHERQHLRQQLILGIFQWIAYLLVSVVIWMGCPNLHAYAANPFELDARRAAGQGTDDIGPKNGDRWPWW